MKWENILKAPIWNIHQKVNITPDMRIVASPRSFEDKDTWQNRRGVSRINKPRGLWYALGNDWIKWIKGNDPMWSNRYSYVYEIHLTGNILKLKTKQDHIDFFHKYAEKDAGEDEWGKYSRHKINWGRVKSDYAGIEVMGRDFHDESLVGYRSLDVNPLQWLWTWDVNGGVVWDVNAWKVGKLLFSTEDKLWEEVDSETYWW